MSEQQQSPLLAHILRPEAKHGLCGLRLQGVRVDRDTPVCAECVRKLIKITSRRENFAWTPISTDPGVDRAFST